MKTLLRSRLVLGSTFLALLGGIVYACSNFLDTPAQGTLDQNALLTKTGVEGSLIAAYRILDCTESVGAWGCAASNWVFGDVTSDDSYKGSEASDQPGATQIELYTWNSGPASAYLDQKWATVYEGVVRANSTLRLLEQVRADKPGEINDADAAGIKGEALFLRAHYHFEAWRMWGRVPYYKEDDTDPRKPNDITPDSVAALISADLDSAIAYLPDAPRNGDAGRAMKCTAKAYKGRLQVYQHLYAAAITTLTDVVNTCPFGCCGFHQPSQNLANFYAVDGATGLPKAFVDSAGWNNRDSTWVASVTDTVDPRLDWTIGRDNVPYKDWGLHLPIWIRAPGYGGRYSPKKNVAENASGSTRPVGWNAAQLNSVHIHLFRYADMLLLLAEAQVEAGGAPGLVAANTIVNQIRARADSTAQGCGGGFNAAAESLLVATYPQCANDSRLAVPINDPSITWATYKVSAYPAFATQAQARRAVQIERRLELGMEGQRFFDLRRYGQAIATTTINDYLNKEKTGRPYKTAQLPFAVVVDR